MKNILKSIAPVFIIKFWRSFRSPWKGDFPDWKTCEAISTKYDSEKIINKILDSALKVKNGVYKYERDSVLFEEIEISWPVAFAILHCRLRYQDLFVLDFGGALGSTFFQNKYFLDLSKTKWIIVEQEKIVNLGNLNISDKNIEFETNIETVFNKYKINFVLISSTLQYIENPYKVLSDIVLFKPKYIVLDRLSIIDSNRDIIALQKPNASIYEGSYPCRFFEKENIFKLLKNDYYLFSEFDSFVKNDGVLNFRYNHKDIGAIFILKENPAIVSET